jgi:UDP-N-acetylmuramate--alanine ligase
MLAQNSHIHLIGIGGVSMSGIAKILARRGYQVSGSDLSAGKYFNLLKKEQIELFVGHKAEQIAGADLIVKTSAVAADNSELQAAQKAGIKVVKRAEILAELMKNKKTIAVAGTHGKTTTTAMLATIFKKAGLDPAIMVGGYLSEIAGNTVDGQGEYFITEADESDGSFIYFDPDLLLITNLEWDHPDYYHSLTEFKQVFKDFSAKNDKKAVILYNSDDYNLLELFAQRKKAIRFSLKQGDYLAKNISYQAQKSSFDLYYKQKYLGQFKLAVPGQYNIYNALAAISAADYAGVSFEIMQAALANFTGVGRRFEFKGTLLNGQVDLIDDYAHHPTEIRSLLKAVKAMDYQKITVVFQPHRYSRTRQFFTDFAAAFKEADQVYLTNIFSASEKNNQQVSLRELETAIAKNSQVECYYLSEFSKIAAQIKTDLEPGQIILTVGAGDITSLSDILLN